MKFKTPFNIILKVISIFYPTTLLTSVFFLQNKNLESILLLSGSIILCILFIINLFRYLWLNSDEIIIFGLFFNKRIPLSSIKSIDIDIVVSGYPAIKGLKTTILTKEKEEIDITNLSSQLLIEKLQEKYPKKLNFKKTKVDILKFLKSTTILTYIFLSTELMLTVYYLVSFNY